MRISTFGKRKAIMGKRMHRRRRVRRRGFREVAAAATINSPREKRSKAILEDVNPDLE